MRVLLVRNRRGFSIREAELVELDRILVFAVLSLFLDEFPLRDDARVCDEGEELNEPLFAQQFLKPVNELVSEAVSEEEDVLRGRRDGDDAVRPQVFEGRYAHHPFEGDIAHLDSL